MTKKNINLQCSCCVTLFHGQFHPQLISLYLSFSIFLSQCLPTCCHYFFLPNQLLTFHPELILPLSLMHFCRRFATSSRLILLFSLRYLHVIVLIPPVLTYAVLAAVHRSVWCRWYCKSFWWLTARIRSSPQHWCVRIHFISFHNFNIQTHSVTLWQTLWTWFSLWLIQYDPCHSEFCCVLHPNMHYFVYMLCNYCPLIMLPISFLKFIAVLSVITE